MRYVCFILLLVVFVLGAYKPASATHIQEVTSRSGVKAWLVEDHKLPLVAMHFAFRGGVEQDPASKQGLANLSVRLLSQGAGNYDALTFQQKLSEHSIQMRFEAGRDALEGTLKSLSADRQTAFELLALALTKPRVEVKDFERARDEQLTGIRAQFASPEWQARYALFQKIFASHPYGYRRLGTTKTLASLTRDDVRNFIASHFARDNLVVAVAGDISPADLSKLLDQTFGQLPRHARLVKVEEAAWPQTVSTVLTRREGTQTQLLFALPGPKQDDPDYDAVEIANYILGGGGFASRLMQDVRDKKGLTYGINMGLSPADHCGVILGQSATDNPKTREAWEIIQSTMRHFYEDGVSEKEIATAKDFLTGSMPLTMTSTDRIATSLVDIQLHNKPITYLEKHSEDIRKVTSDDVQAAIHRWFNPDRVALSMVGNPEGMTATEVRDLVRE